MRHYINVRHLNIRVPVLALSHLPMQLKTLITFAYKVRIRHNLVHRNPLSIANNENHPKLYDCHEQIHAHTCLKVTVVATKQGVAGAARPLVKSGVTGWQIPWK